MSKSISAEANKIVSNYTKGAAAVSLLPMPLVDAVLVSAAQLKMVQSLAHAYGVPFSSVGGKAAIGALLGSTLPLSLRTSLISLSKGVPVLGAVVGLVGMSALSSAVTYALGRAFIMHFASGGTFLNFDSDKLRAYYLGELKSVKGKAFSTYAGVKP